jgi:hypothetical protein
MPMSKKIFLLFSLTLLYLYGATGCKKEFFLSKGNLEFSTDTLVFDTVFTTIGSTTKHFKLYNKENRTVKIDKVELVGGSSSPFRINLDGLKGTQFQNLTLEGGDSLFAFVEVTLNINNQLLPMVVEDSIRFVTNGKEQYVHLAVWGQDAYFHYKDLNEGVWPNDKPHVIFGYAAVDSSKTLTIPADTKIHLHKNAILYVYKGALNINGTKDHEVVFTGDRLESAYDNVSGQYYGIYLHQAKPSSINYAIIQNGTAGIHLYGAENSGTNYTLNLSNSIINNHARYGVFIYSGARVKAENCILAKNGTHAVMLLEGGDINLNHCNLLGYGAGTNQAPAVGLSNFYMNNFTQTLTIGSINEGTITNSVIWGQQTVELAINTKPYSGTQTLFQLKNNVIKSDPIPSDPYFVNCIWNKDPLFTKTQDYDFTFPTNSPLNNSADPTLSLATDINGNPRNPSTPDIGAIEN